jgi:integrase/ribosomal protein L40E
MATDSGERLFHTHGSATYYKENLDKVEHERKISADDKDLLLKYIGWRNSNQSLSGLRKTKIAQIMTGWRQFIKKPWIECTADDIRDGMGLLSESKYSQNTRNDYWKDLKPFMKWLKKRGLSNIDIEDISEIKGAGVNVDSHSPEDLLSLDEVDQIISASGSTRNRALVSLLFESCARIYEISRLKWGDLDFSKPPLVQLKIHQTKTERKTGVKYRHVPLIRNVAYLGAWRNEYKSFTGKEPTLDDFVFVDERRKQMAYPAMRQVIVRAAKAAGLDKRVHPHLFRASAITQLVRENYNQSTICEVAWGNVSSNMFRHYVRLSREDINREFQQKAGITIQEDQNKPRVPIICPHCSCSNPPSARHCMECTTPLTAETKKSFRRSKEQAELQPEYQKIADEYAAKLLELQAGKTIV